MTVPTFYLLERGEGVTGQDVRRPRERDINVDDAALSAGELISGDKIEIGSLSGNR